MSKNVNKKLVGAFVLGAAGLLIAGLILFGAGDLFKTTAKYILYFDGSAKGLSAGAPVTFRGVNIGSVKEIGLIFDPVTKAVLMPVVVEVEPRIKGDLNLIAPGSAEKMVEMGLRAKLEVQSFLTGQLMISFDFYPNKPAKLRGAHDRYQELPTLAAPADIIAMMSEMPMGDIAQNLNDSVKGLNKILNSNALQGNLEQLNTTMQELQMATRSIRLLTEYLEQHPESLLKGKAESNGK